MLIDLSQQLTNGVESFPGDPDFRLEQIADITTNGYSNFMLHSGMHIATHVDGVGHLINSDLPISQASLDKFCGEAIVLDYRNSAIIDYSITLENLIVDGKIVLINTGHDKKWGHDGYFSAHPIITEKLANWFISKQVKMIGIDFPSPDTEPYNVHKLLLSNDILILENLTNLDRLIGYKELKIMAFPLKLTADSSPVRAVAEVTF